MSTVVPDSPFLVKAYYEWKPGESDLLSRMFLALKDRRSSGAWTYHAEQFARQRIGELGQRPIWIVPAPSRLETQKDHAYLWGEALAYLMGAEFKPCLARASDSHQRGGDRAERALIEMRLREKYTGTLASSSEALLVFVDDIYTTGATARAAYRALGSPPHFEVWVLAHRSLSCGASGDLL